MKSKIGIFTLLALSPFNLFAQAEASANSGGLAPELLLIIYVVVALMLLVTLMLWRVSIHLKKFVKGEYESAEQKMYDDRTTWEKIFQVKPLGTDKDMMLDHEYDGIRELDNPAPPWFMFLFYGTILFAVIYFVRFSITGDGPTQLEEYTAQMEEAQAEVEQVVVEKGANIDENSVTLLTETDAIASGKKIYITNCKICHMDGGAGGVGPNLTDEFWIHGGGVKNIFKTVKYGVPEKGMVAWDGTLTPEQIAQVSSYIISLEGSNPPGGIDPQGEVWVPEPEESSEPVVEGDSLTDETAVETEE